MGKELAIQAIAIGAGVFTVAAAAMLIFGA